MAEFKCLDCNTVIDESEDKVNRDGGYPCPNCGTRGMWARA